MVLEVFGSQLPSGEPDIVDPFKKLVNFPSIARLLEKMGKGVNEFFLIGLYQLSCRLVD